MSFIYIPFLPGGNGIALPLWSQQSQKVLGKAADDITAANYAPIGYDLG